MPGLVGPQNFPIRDPEDQNQQNGRNINPVRYPEMGGLDSPAKWTRPGGKSDQSIALNLERATNVRAAKPTTGKNVD